MGAGARWPSQMRGCAELGIRHAWQRVAPTRGSVCARLDVAYSSLYLLLKMQNLACKAIVQLRHRRGGSPDFILRLDPHLFE